MDILISGERRVVESKKGSFIIILLKNMDYRMSTYGLR